MGTSPRASSDERLVVAGGVRVRGDALSLRLHGPRANLALRVSGLAAAAASRIPEPFLDLVEIACFVDAADAALPRSSRRRVRMVIPLRAADLYRTPEVFVPLERTLAALTGDLYRFDFRARTTTDRGALAYFDPASEREAEDFGAKTSLDVVPFSGGLDSFAGAFAGTLTSTLARKRPSLLVAHRASPRIDAHVRTLAARLGDRARLVSSWLSRETTREGPARAFVWTAISLAIAAAHGARSAVRFHENGVVSLGLPFSAATTFAGTPTANATHPQVLAGWARLAAALGRPVAVDNGFLWSTKAEVVRGVVSAGAAGWIVDTISCTRRVKPPFTHCGVCAACVDRRFATLAAGAEAHDPAARYAIDLLTGERADATSRAVLSAYLRAASEIGDATDAEFFARHGELARVLSHLARDPHQGAGSIDDVASRIVELHRRHAGEVEAVLDAGIRTHATAIRRGTLPKSSLLMLSLRPETEKMKPIPRRAPPGVVRVLHLSDFHFSPRRAWDQDPVLGALAADVARLVASGLRPDLVALTGDIADRGTREDYALAARWLRERLLPAAKASTESLLLVPGNHDVDRAAVKRVAQAAQADLIRGESQDAIAALLSDVTERTPLLRRHDAWLEFVRGLGLPVSEDAVPWWSRTLDVSGLRVHVAGLCSSWTSSSDDDKGRLLVGRAQLHRVLEGWESADLSLALVHHPWDYLADFDAAEVRETIQRRCDVLLRGHLHKTDGASRIRPDGGALELAAGAAWGGSQHPHAYHLVELEPQACVARVHLRTWDGHAWIADRNAFGGSAPDGIAELPLRTRA